MENILGDSWDSLEEIESDFEEKDLRKRLLSFDKFIAIYDLGDYDGQALVVFQENGKYYEVHGSHCSCMGLEHQWSEEEVGEEVFLHRLENGSGMYTTYRKELTMFFNTKHFGIALNLLEL